MILISYMPNKILIKISHCNKALILNYINYAAGQL